MRKIITTVIVCLTLCVFSPFSVQADDVLLDCNPNGTTVMSVGDIVACIIDPVADTDIFMFSGNVGETFRLTLTETSKVNSPAPCLELFDPDTQSVDSWCSQNTGVSRQFTLDKTGTYTILVYEAGDDQGVAYHIALQRKFPPPPEALTLPFGFVYVDETISPVADSDVYLFGGVQNDLIRLTLTETSKVNSPAPCLGLYDPDTQPVDSWCAQNTGVSRQFTLDKTGTYTILVVEAGDDQGVTYNIGLECISGVCPPVPICIFEDVPPGYWAEEFIYKIYEAGITSGCSQDPLLYCPEDPVTRAQMAVFLVRGIHGSDFIPPPASGIFDDVPVDYWAADWIEQFYNDGITSGCSQNPLLYCPENLVTRAQMAVFLLRSKHGSDYTPPAATGIFDDVPVDYWAADWIEQLYNEGITSGCSQNPLLYCPESSVTRAQMAVFIVRTFDL